MSRAKSWGKPRFGPEKLGASAEYFSSRHTSICLKKQKSHSTIRLYCGNWLTDQIIFQDFYARTSIGFKLQIFHNML